MAAINRLAELRAGTASGGESNPFAEEKPEANESGNQEIAGHMQLYEPIKSGLEQIQSNVGRIERLKEKSRTIAKEKDIKEIMRQLDGIMSETTGKGGKIKAALDNIKRLNEQHKQGNKGQTAITQMRINLYQTHIRRFHSIMNEYNSAAHDFKQNLQNRTRRQLRIVDAEITEDEIEKIVSSGQADGVIKEVLINDNMKTVVREIEERHLDILKLEKQVMEVYELFRDLATLVDIQQESLDVIENRIVHAQEYASKGEEELRKAETHQRKSRRKTCCLIIILLIVLVVLALGLGLSFS